MHVVINLIILVSGYVVKPAGGTLSCQTPSVLPVGNKTVSLLLYTTDLAYDHHNVNVVDPTQIELFLSWDQAVALENFRLHVVELLVVLAIVLQ